MKTLSVEIQWDGGPENEEGENGAIRCPKCGASWVRIYNGDAVVPKTTECPHLKLIIQPGSESPDDYDYYNGFSKEQLLKSLATASKKHFTGVLPRTPEELLPEILLDDNLLKAVAIEGIDAIASYMQERTCCCGGGEAEIEVDGCRVKIPPSSETCVFGVEFESPKERG